MRQQQVPLDDEVSFDVHALYTWGGNGEARIWEEEEANVLNNHLQQHQYTTTGIQHQSMLK